MKKSMIVVVSLVMAAAFVTGCTAKSGNTVKGETSRTGEKGTIPIAVNKPTLSMFIAGGYAEKTTSFDYKDNLYTRQVVDQTGIQLKITATTAADAMERLNVLLNTGDYPEVIVGYPDLEYYASQGIIVPLDKELLLSYPHIKRLFEEYPEVYEKITGADGNIYALPAVEECLHCTYAMGRLWYYMPWVRDSGRRVPETLDELTEYLRFVKNTDLNRNGKKDEMGILFQSGDLKNFIAYIAKAYMPFIYTYGYFGLGLDNNRRVTEQYRDDNYREALRYINGLYKEGLIVQDSFSMNVDQETAILRGEFPQVALVASSWVNTVIPPDSPRFLEHFYLPPVKGPAGQQWASNTDTWGNARAHYFITDKCKDPELAIALYDYLCSPTGWANIGGPKGISWDDPDPGALGYNGRPAKLKALIAHGAQPLNSSWYDIGLAFGLKEDRYGIQVDGADTAIRWLATGDKSLENAIFNNTSYVEFMFYAISMDASKYALPNSSFIPPLQVNSTDSARMADINAVLDSFKDQAAVEFITGTRDISSDAAWNAYLAELDRLGSKEMVSILQKYIK